MWQVKVSSQYVDPKEFFVENQEAVETAVREVYVNFPDKVRPIVKAVIRAFPLGIATVRENDDRFTAEVEEKILYRK